MTGAGLLLAGMGDVINFRRVRKNSERQFAEQKAAANRVRHGRSKAERSLERARNLKERRDLNHHLIERGDE